VELAIKKTEHGWKWVVRGSFKVSEFQGCKNGWDSEGASSRAEDSGFLASLGRTTSGERSVVIPWMFAAADPCASWWLRLRGNPKRAGEISQAAFLLKAEMLGYHLALPWGDSERYDFAVWGCDGPAMRVQVKGTGRLHRGGYEVQPVHATRKGGKKRYTKKDIDVIAAHVQPEDAWYRIPIEKVGRAKSLRLHPGAEEVAPPGKQRRSWEEWRGRWDVLGRV
jgi:PD-(D/E)XK nuclease superfamily protein